MSNLDEIKKLIKEHVKLIEISPEGIKDAGNRCTKFLTVVAILTNYKYKLDCNRAKVVTVMEALYADAMDEALGKTITEKKTNTARNKNYTTAREQLEQLDAQINWIKTYQKIFENAHLVYRQQSKEQM